MGFGVQSTSIAISNPVTSVTVSNPTLATKAVDTNNTVVQASLGSGIAAGATVTILNGIDVSLYQSIAVQWSSGKAFQLEFTWTDPSGVYVIMRKIWECPPDIVGQYTLIMDNHYGSNLTLVARNIDTAATTGSSGYVVFNQNRVLPGEQAINYNVAHLNPTPDGPDGIVWRDTQVVAATSSTAYTGIGIITPTLTIDMTRTAAGFFDYKWGLNGDVKSIAFTATNALQTVTLNGPRRCFYYRWRNTAAGTNTVFGSFYSTPRYY